MDLQGDNPEKGQLLKRSAHHRELLEEEVKQITERSNKIVTNALIIGGALALTYVLVSTLSKSTNKKKERPGKITVSPEKEADPAAASESSREEAGIMSQIGAALVAQATSFLLSIAREKLVEYLQSQAVKKENVNDRS